MNQDTFVTKLYQAVDAQDVSTLAGRMTEDGIFRFANIPAVQGRDNISAFLSGFYQTIKSIKHSGIESWSSDGVTFVTGNVTYVSPTDFILTVPFGVLLKFRGELISEWLIFVDNSELYK